MTIETIHVGVHGLNCPNCAAKVERAIASLPGVDFADVEFETESATLEYDRSAVTLERIARAVLNTGCDSKRFTVSRDGRRIAPDGGSTDTDDAPRSRGGCDDGDGCDDPGGASAPF